MAGGASIAKAYVQIVPSAQGIKGSLENVLSGEADSAGRSAGSKFTSAMGGVLKISGVALAAAATGVTAFGKSAVTAGMDFDGAMSQVAATMGTTVDQIGELRELALEMGSSTAFSATEAAEALNYMALAGYDSATSMSMLPNVLNLAAAGGMDLAAASDMITDSQSALNLTLDETSVLVDQMAQAASKSNTSVSQLGEAILTVGGTASFMSGGTQELSTVLGIMADNGIKGAEGGTHLRNMLLSLSAPTDKAAAQLKELGVEIFDAEGNMRSFSEIFPEMQTAMAGLTDQQKVEALSKIFNTRDIAAATALMSTSVDRWHELSGAIGDADGAAQKMAETQLDNLAGDITMFKSALEGTKIAISDSLTPTLREFVQFGTEGLSGITEALRGGGGLAEAAASIGGFLADGLSRAVSALPSLLDAGRQLLQGLLLGIQEHLPELATGAVQTVTSLVGFLTDNLPLLVEVAMQMIPALIQGLADAAPELIGYLPELVTMISTTILDNLPLILDAGIQLLFAVLQGVVTAVPQLIGYMPQIIGSLFRALVSGVGTLLGAGVQLLGGVLSGIGQGIGKVLDIGKNIVVGIWNGIAGGFDWIVGKLRGWVDSVLSYIKGLFGIHSPSTIMRDQVGVFLARGIGEGFEDGMSDVERSMRDAMPDLGAMVEAAELDASVTATAVRPAESLGGSRVTYGDIIINVDTGGVECDEDELAQRIAYRLQEMLAGKEA